jgi:succinate dehydrogenase/fumarate reductase cytochrome b subunit
MPTIFWKLITAAVLVLNGIVIMIRKKKSGISFSEQYKNEKWIILILMIVIIILIPLFILF